ncbi:hypothetical protein FNF27_03433 [Cafeteria roenbergensis]|uniref:Aspartate aminotransferase n=2 Tax=Cafeteria roenbergensis TaxID=33653 RepID=A0A5A8DCV2_CAFRO|nr:hypothetical protein FNF29_06738 [Cafeteria roenbergensis]KAA0161497.1 hypothetical protein FNF31_03780 [Cafeteria roenbergensis]KAA0163236.1 hypothetical protein FNF28_04386 [Cafeteria roenbergensis]KAA0175135.1 hypothetical protein FNF27_03433 [Cafeteria roenbergensis]|eukprot:KAA0148351.1 hypothetical protein FNF29_06738 [Cafeteria roenbergensis]
MAAAVTATRTVATRRAVGQAMHAAGSTARAFGAFSDIPLGAADPILGLNEAFKQSTSPEKVNVGVGAYRDEEGKPHKLDCVREAQRRILERDLDLEYTGIAGIPEFVSHAIAFAYGNDSPVLREDRVAAVQSLSGTGALRVASEFIARFRGAGTPIYVPNKTWGNHIPIAENAGLSVKRYRYYSEGTCGLDFEGLVEDLRAMPEQSVVLLHACAHNPTGVDPTEEQWDQVLAVVQERDHTVLFDSAYQGFASGDADADAFAIRLFAAAGVDMLLCQSFAKNFGLYGERVGALSVVCQSPEEVEHVLSQLKLVIRPMYSSPPISGARIVTEVLGDAALRAKWYAECKGMATRISAARVRLREEVERLGTDRDWSHITSQIGMFCFTGLTPEQCDRMVSDHAVFMTRDGRISMAGVTQANAPRIAAALHDVTCRA